MLIGDTSKIELEFGCVGFWGEGKTGAPGEKPLGARTRTNNKLNPHMTPGPGGERSSWFLFGFFVLYCTADYRSFYLYTKTIRSFTYKPVKWNRRPQQVPLSRSFSEIRLVWIEHVVKKKRLRFQTKRILIHCGRGLKGYNSCKCVWIMILRVIFTKGCKS